MNLRSLTIAAFVGMFLPCLSGSAESILRMKSGEVRLTVLDADGIRPLANVDVKVQNARQEADLIQAMTDRSGSCSLTLDQGTYGLAIAGKTVALIHSEASAETTHLRLVTPRKPLLIGGADGTNTTNQVENAAGAVNTGTEGVLTEEASRRGGLFYWVGQNGLKTALIIGGAVATGIIIENENDDSSSSTTPPATPQPPPTRGTRSSTPDIDPPVSN